jgi:hypothetical protein
MLFGSSDVRFNQLNIGKNMLKLNIGKSLKDEDVLWRYLHLEGFINLLESNALHFSPLTAYQRSDPFEGFMPRVAMEALASVTAQSQKRMIEHIDALEQKIGLDKGRQQISQLRADVANHPTEMKEVYKKIMSCLMVNCWHKNEHESEAMWGLYSKSGVAIKTTVGSIKSALEKNQQAHVIGMGAIKYIDFADKALTAGDCVTEDGHLMGMIKRVAYAHEKEVRMYITRVMDRGAMESIQPSPTSVEVDVMRLIEEVVISPFASASLRKSIQAVSRKYGIDLSKVSSSPLLDNCEYLLDAYTLSSDELS